MLTERRIGIVTDSSSQITDELVERFDIEVVPMTVTIDGVDHLEGDELDADAFYEAFVDGATPEVGTSQPSPGRFTEAYARVAARGVDQIVSLHLSATMSGTVDSARVAAPSAPVEVTVIDTGSASFGVSVCVWAAGIAVDRGANIADLERRVANLVPRIATSFMVGVPMLTERGGRAAEVDLSDDGIAVLGMADGKLDVLERVTTIDDTIDVMSTYATSWGDGVTVAIGTSDQPSRPLSDRLDRALSGLAAVDEVIHYRIGPSVGAHTGPGTFGLFVFPTIR
ncbi:MAG: DegV family protein [Ilumatobacteraceae bacterium]|nr:DegV family protein [Ilumatobacteraceae bacterium]